MTDKRSFRQAVGWAFVMNLGQQGIAAVITFILAALLGPHEFGVLAIAMIYIAFVQMILDQGMDAALIQRKDLQPLHLDSAFWMILGASLLLAAVSVALSGWWASVNHLPELALIISVLSLTIPIKGLTIVQQAVLKREMDFRALAVRANVSVFLGGGAGIGMAFAGLGVWALVGQQLSTAILSLFLLWRLSSWRPRFRLSIAHFRDLLGFSLAAFAGKLGTFAQARSDALLMGIFFGPLAVGLYRFADRLMNMLLMLVTRSISIVALPDFSRFQDDPQKLKERVLSCIRLSSITTIPAMFGLAALSNYIVALIGAQWAPAGDVLKILCVVGFIKAFTLFTAPLLRAVSKPHVEAAMSWVMTILTTGSFVLVAVLLKEAAVTIQILAMAASRAAVFVIIFTPLNIVLAIRSCRFSFREFMEMTSPALLSGIACIVTVTTISASGVARNLAPVTGLAVTAIPAGIIGGAVLFLLDPRLWAEILNLVNGRYRAAPKASVD